MIQATWFCPMELDERYINYAEARKENKKEIDNNAVGKQLSTSVVDKWLVMFAWLPEKHFIHLMPSKAVTVS